MVARLATLLIVALLTGLVMVGCDRCNRTPPRRYLPPVVDGGPSHSPGCGIARASPRAEKHETSGRSFWIWGPSSSQYDEMKTYPVVVTLHGYGGNGLSFEKWFEMEKYVGGEAFVVYPNAANNGVWDFHGDSDLDFIAHVLDAVGEQYCIDRSRVLAFGFSFGAKMAQHLGCKRPDLVKAAAAGAGSWAEKTPTCGRPIPVLLAHRTKDDNELLEWAKDASNRWARVNECSSETEPSELGHNCIKHRGCTPPGSVTFCEDTHYDPSWQRSWNHTVRPEYIALVWKWFSAL